MSLIFPGPVVLPWSESCSWRRCRLEWSLQWDLCQRRQAGCRSRSPLPSFHHHWKLCLCIWSCHLHLKQPQPWSLWSSPCLVMQACVLSFQRFLWEFLCFPSRTAPSHPLYNYPHGSQISASAIWLTDLTAGFQCFAGSLIHSFTHLFIHLISPSLTYLCISSSIHSLSCPIFSLYLTEPKETSCVICWPESLQKYKDSCMHVPVWISENIWRGLMQLPKICVTLHFPERCSSRVVSRSKAVFKEQVSLV